MGDKIEITTLPNQLNTFFKVSSNALIFEVKAAGFVGIGLGSQPKSPCYVWIGIGCAGDKTWIGRPYENHKEVHTPKILSKDKYKSFLLTWINDSVTLVQAGETLPLVSLKLSTSSILYVTFSIAENGSEAAQWRFELPPLLTMVKQVPVKGGITKWVKKSRRIPQDALLGGYEKGPLYIMRAPHNNSLTPGKLVPSENKGFLPWGGRAHAKSDFEILCGYNCIWEKTSSDKIPAGSVIGGYSEDRHETLYVGRAEHDGHLIPGKVQPSHKVCYVGYDGREIGKSEYEILVAPEDNERSANKIYLPNMREVPRITPNVHNFAGFQDHEYQYEDEYSSEEDLEA